MKDMNHKNTTGRVRRVLFVRTGNICRSPLAHAVFEKKARDCGMKFEVESAGTHGYHVGENADSRMRRAAAGRGVPFDHPARRFTASDLEYYDYIFAMDRGHYREIQRLSRQARHTGRPDGQEQIRMFREFDPRGSIHDDVPDPYYGGASDFNHVFDIVDRTVTVILEAFRQGSL